MLVAIYEWIVGFPFIIPLGLITIGLLTFVWKVYINLQHRSSLGTTVGLIVGIAAGIVGIIVGVIQIGVFFGWWPG